MTANHVANVFRALGDPVRLEMIQRLARDRSAPIGVVSRDLGITRQGARKHLQVLVEADLVRLTPKGRDTLVELDPATLDWARAFIADLEKQWEVRLAALKAFVELE